MKTQNNEKNIALAEAQFPYAFMVEKRTVDACRRGFIAGLNYVPPTNKKFIDMSRADACKVAQIVYYKDLIFAAIEEKNFNCKGIVAYKLDGVAGQPIWITFTKECNFELTLGDDYNKARPIGIDAKAAHEAYEFLKGEGYEIN